MCNLIMDYFFYPQVPASFGVIVLVRTAASCSAPYAYKPGYSNSSLPLNKSMVMETGQPANRGKSCQIPALLIVVDH